MDSKPLLAAPSPGQVILKRKILSNHKMNSLTSIFTLKGWFQGRTGVGVDGDERVEIDMRAGGLFDVNSFPNKFYTNFSKIASQLRVYITNSYQMFLIFLNILLHIKFAQVFKIKLWTL